MYEENFISYIGNATFFICLLVFKNPKKKDQERAEQRAEFIAELQAINKSEPNHYEVSLSTKDTEFWPDAGHYPKSWPRIRRDMPIFDQKAMEWVVIAGSDPHKCIQILEPAYGTQITSMTTCTTFNWHIKPLAKGIATVKVRYASKEGNKIEDEHTITVTVTD